MCEPATMAAISLATTVVGTGVSVYGAVQQGQAQKQAASYQAQVARNNAWLAEKQAQDAVQRGGEAEMQHRVKVNQVMGAQRASLAGQGADLSSGSPLDILGDTAAAGTLDALTVRSNYARDAWGYRTQKTNYQAQAGLLDMQARNAGAAAWVGAASSLLGGASSFADKWAGFRSKGSI